MKTLVVSNIGCCKEGRFCLGHCDNSKDGRRLWISSQGYKMTIIPLTLNCFLVPKVLVLL